MLLSLPNNCVRGFWIRYETIGYFISLSSALFRSVNFKVYAIHEMPLVHYWIIKCCSFIIVTYVPNKFVHWGCLHITGHDLRAKGAI